VKCPACNRQRLEDLGSGFYRCRKCESVFSSNCRIGDSYNYVLPYMAKEPVPPDQLRYYDFTCLSSKGLGRRHGWFDPETKLIHQIG
jgi:hypothetical protein